MVFATRGGRRLKITMVFATPRRGEIVNYDNFYNLPRDLRPGVTILEAERERSKRMLESMIRVELTGTTEVPLRGEEEKRAITAFGAQYRGQGGCGECESRA